MAGFLRFLTYASIAIWSLFAWGSYALVDNLGGFLGRNADAITGGEPELTVFLSWFVQLFESIGLVAVVIVWAIVALVMLAVGLLLAKVFDRGPRYRGALPPPPAANAPLAPRDPAAIARDAMNRAPPAG